MEYLFVIDYQKDFVDGTLGFPGAEKLDARIAEKVRAYGKGKVFFTRDTHFPDYLTTREGRNLPIQHCLKGSEGWQVYGRTRQALEDVEAVAIDKVSFGMDVTDPAVAAVLPKKADKLEIVGLVSNICVVSNAMTLQGHYPNAQIVVDANLTASFDGDLHEKTLDVLAGVQAEILNR